MKRTLIAALTVLLTLLGVSGVFLPAGAAEGTTTAADRMGWGAPLNGDDFNYTGAPDSTKWSVYNGPGHHGNGLRAPEQNKVANGYLTISGDAAGKTGGMSAKFNRQVYARWEARMRTSARDPEYHPVLILWPADNSTSNCDEVDYAEGTGDTTLIKFFLHYECAGDPTVRAQKTLNTQEWHNYAVDWSKDAVVGYIDGVEWFRTTDPNVIPRAAMKQTLQMDWFPDGSALTPSWMQVDWVKVYAAGTGAPPVATAAPAPAPTASTAPAPAPAPTTAAPAPTAAATAAPLPLPDLVPVLLKPIGENRYACTTDYPQLNTPCTINTEGTAAPGQVRLRPSSSTPGTNYCTITYEGRSTRNCFITTQG